MPQKISPEAFFEQAAKNEAREKKKDIANGKQILKKLQPKTEKITHERWHYGLSQFPETSISQHTSLT